MMGRSYTRTAEALVRPVYNRWYYLWHLTCCVEFERSPSKASSSDPRSPPRSPVPRFLKRATRLIDEASYAFADDMYARYVARDSWMGRLAQTAWLRFFLAWVVLKSTGWCMVLRAFLVFHIAYEGVPSRGQILITLLCYDRELPTAWSPPIQIDPPRRTGLDLHHTFTGPTPSAPPGAPALQQ